MRRTPIRTRSAKRAKLYRDHRVPLVKASVGKPCEVGPALKRVCDAYDDCTGRAQTLHERRKRSAGGSVLKLANVMPSCFICNDAVENIPMIHFAQAAGVVVREGDPEWDELGKGDDER